MQAQKTTEKTTEKTAELALMRQLTAADMAKVNALIIRRAESEIPLIPQMIQHVVLSGGKRLRPALTLLCAKLLGYQGAQHIALAACVEFIHTATLLHDDVVDESKLRRGLATANDVWGNKASVLVGDFLLSRAFQLMVEEGSLEVLRILSDASAVIAQGEVLQLTTSNDLQTTEAQYLQVIIGKTATLFAAACELAAVAAMQPEHQPRLRQLGLSLGIAFQMMDDGLDYIADPTKLGKSIGDDFREGKITLPVIHAFAHGTAEEQRFWQRTMENQEQTEADFTHALTLLQKHRAVEYTLQKALSFCHEAQDLLNIFPTSPEKAALEEIITFCTRRAY
jgi:octaprenyl-diphosphate synthase